MPVELVESRDNMKEVKEGLSVVFSFGGYISHHYCIITHPNLQPVAGVGNKMHGIKKDDIFRCAASILIL